MRPWTVCLPFALAVSAWGGCGNNAPPGTDAGAPAQVAQGEEPGWEEAVRIIDVLPRCDVDHRGLLVDMGSGALAGRLAWSVMPGDMSM